MGHQPSARTIPTPKQQVTYYDPLEALNRKGKLDLDGVQR